MQKNNLCLLIIILVIPFLAIGQTKKENSPYSRFGIGNMHLNHYGLSRNMGGIGIGLRDSLSVNVSNPASYSSLIRRNKTFSVIVFETGLDVNNLFLSNNTEKVQTGDVTLSHLLIGLPIHERWGLALGALPFSSVSYEVNETITDPILGDVLNEFLGQGDITKVFAGLGFDVTPQLSVGLNASYLFGTLEKSRATIYPELTNVFSNRSLNQYSVSDFAFDGGVQYQINLKAGKGGNRKLVLGANAALPAKLNTSIDRFWETFVVLNGIERSVDTILLSNDLDDKVEIPLNYGLGFTYEIANKLIIGANVSMYNWQDFKLAQETDKLKNQVRLAAGFQLTPSVTDDDAFIERITYRGGIEYSNGYLNINNTDIADYGITFGLGIPYRYKKLGDDELPIQQKFDISFKYGQRGTLTNQLFKENYFLTTFSVTINDAWFRKRKIE